MVSVTLCVCWLYTKEHHVAESAIRASTRTLVKSIVSSVLSLDSIECVLNLHVNTVVRSDRGDLRSCAWCGVCSYCYYYDCDDVWWY